MKNGLWGLILGLLVMFQVASANMDDELETLSTVGTSQLDRFQLDVYGAAQLFSSLEEDSLTNSDFSYATFGVEAWLNGRESLNVLSVKGEGQVAYGESLGEFPAEYFAQHDWRRASGLGASLRVGQQRGLVKKNFARPYESALPRPMDVELPFTENLKGVAVSAYWDQQDTLKTPAGFQMSWSFGRPVLNSQNSDTLFTAFPAPRWIWGAGYHIVGYFGPARLDLGWEKEVGHNVSLYTSPHESLNLGMSWTYSFHPDYEVAPDNLYAAKLNWRFWQSQSEKHNFLLSSGLDFGDQAEALQALLGYHWKLPMNAHVKVQAGYDSRYEQPVVALRYYWRP